MSAGQPLAPPDPGLRLVTPENGEGLVFPPPQALAALVEPVILGPIIEARVPDEQWPTYDFTFEPISVVGTLVIPPTPDSRCRHVVGRIRQRVPQSLEEPERAVLVVLSETRTWLEKTATILGESRPRTDILNLDTTLEWLWYQLKAVNHPVTQALTQLQQQMGPEADPKKMQRTIDDVLLVTHARTIVSIYEEFIVQQRAAEVAVARGRSG